MDNILNIKELINYIIINNIQIDRIRYYFMYKDNDYKFRIKESDYYGEDKIFYIDGTMNYNDFNNNLKNYIIKYIRKQKIEKIEKSNKSLFD